MVTQSLADELRAYPLFRKSPYPSYDNDPLAGWLNTFETVSETSLEDLRRIGGLAAGDIVYMNWAWPAHLMALIRWVGTFPADQLPTVIVEVGADTGLEEIGSEGGKPRLLPRDLRRDARALLYRYAARHLPPGPASRLHFITYDPLTSWAFEALLDHPVKTLPMPLSAVATPRHRGGASPITVSVLGHQRREKGYELMPDVAAALLRDVRDIRLLVHNPDRVLVHNSETAPIAATQDEMRKLAAQDTRVRLDERVADSVHWRELFESSDLVLCPYDPARYKFAHSSVACESLASGIPAVVPSHTPLAALLDRFGKPGAAFEAFTAPSVAAAVKEVLGEFDRYAGLAYEASKRWNDTQGPKNAVQAFLDLAESA